MQILNEVKSLECVTRRWSRNGDQLGADTVEISTSVLSRLSFVGIDPIEPYELKEALQKFKNGKHPRVDKVITEMMKYASIEVKIRFLNLLNNCWQSKHISGNWKDARII